MRTASKSASAMLGPSRWWTPMRPSSRLTRIRDLLCRSWAGSMTSQCKGILPGHLWYVAGIPGMGKSFRLMEHAVLAVEAGWDVAFFSLEMPAREVSERIQRMIGMGSEHEYGSPEFYDLLEARTADYGALNIYTGSVSVS